MLDDTDWVLPQHTVVKITKKKYDIALIIPVLNEGERIKKQLNNIAALHLPVDIIIADGGSTDGATQKDVVETLGVRSVIIKHGDGAMSAQMRAAFAYALREDYQFIINMDGNNKDDVDDIRKYIDKLKDGCDCVLPTRFALGGQHINTPLIRVLAIKYFHAPLMSLASRKRMTDTTNSFRGYSRSFLLDPRVKPFRDVFQKYNLPFYLSVKAARLGYNVVEVPTTRRYPEDGSVPTKISGFKAQFGIIIELVLVVVGYYDAKH